MLGRGIETLFKWIETLSRTVQKKLGNGIETVHGVHVEGRRWMNSILFCGEMTIFFCNQTGERHYIILYIIYLSNLHNKLNDPWDETSFSPQWGEKEEEGEIFNFIHFSRVEEYLF